jgi:hypothetical protein
MLTANRTWPRVRNSTSSRAASTATETWASSVEAPIQLSGQRGFVDQAAPRAVDDPD